jgi:hypothetical protein
VSSEEAQPLKQSTVQTAAATRTTTSNIRIRIPQLFSRIAPRRNGGVATLS